MRARQQRRRRGSSSRSLVVAVAYVLRLVHPAVLRVDDTVPLGRGALRRRRGDGSQPAHRLQRPGVDRPRRVLRVRHVHDRAAHAVSTDWPFLADVARRGAARAFVVGVLVGFPGAAREGPVSRARDARARGAVPATHEPLRATRPAARTCVSLARRRARAARAGSRRRGSRVHRRNDQWAYYVDARARRDRARRARVADRAQPVRARADRRARPRGRGRDGRHQRRAGEGARVRDERARTPAWRARASCSCTRLANASSVSTFQLSIEFLVAVVIGGTATVLGPLLGGVARRVQQPLDQRVVPEHAPVLAHQRLGQEPALAGDLRHPARSCSCTFCPTASSAAGAAYSSLRSAGVRVARPPSVPT